MKVNRFRLFRRRCLGAGLTGLFTDAYKRICLLWTRLFASTFRCCRRCSTRTYGRKGLPLPDCERKWHMCGEASLQEILFFNERIQTVYVFREMLQSALACKDPNIMEQSLDKFVLAVKTSGIPELEKMWRMLESG